MIRVAEVAVDAMRVMLAAVPEALAVIAPIARHVERQPNLSHWNLHDWSPALKSRTSPHPLPALGAKDRVMTAPVPLRLNRAHVADDPLAKMRKEPPVVVDHGRQGAKERLVQRLSQSPTSSVPGSKMIPG